MIELTNVECDYLLDLLANAHTELLHELHHARTRSFEESLRERARLNEELMHKIETEAATLGVPKHFGAAR